MKIVIDEVSESNFPKSLIVEINDDGLPTQTVTVSIIDGEGAKSLDISKKELKSMFQVVAYA